MPTYQFEAMNAQGEEVKDEIEALSSEEALAKIRNLGYFPTKIKEKGARRARAKAGPRATTARKSPRRTRGRVSVKNLTQFTRQMSILQDAGLPILRSLRILEQQQKKGTTLRAVAGAVADDVEAGSTLSEAMARYPRTFNTLYSSMIAAGEAGGVLDLILSRLAEFMEKSQRLKSKVISAMVYPVFVMTISFGIVMGLMVYIVPKFKDVFSDMDTKLPAPTQFLLNTSEWLLKKYGIVYVIVTPIALLILLRIIRFFKKGRYVVDFISMQLPVLGKILSRTSVSRFSRTLGTLISAGVPILEALNITRDTAGNEVFRKVLGEVHDSIRKGESFSEPLRKSKMCDALVVNMFDVGEETGDLDKMLVKIADNYDEEIDNRVAALVSMMEPALVIMLGGICGFIVVALYMPMIELIKKFGSG